MGIAVELLESKSDIVWGMDKKPIDNVIKIRRTSVVEVKMNMISEKGLLEYLIVKESFVTHIKSVVW